MVDKIIIYDNCDENYASVFYLKEPMKPLDIENMIYEMKDRVGYDKYTWDDLFELMEPLCTDIEDLFVIPRIGF